MAENLRKVKAVLEELFKGKDSALAKYARVRHCKYEMDLWWRYKMPLSEIDPKQKRYFSATFLKKGLSLSNADSKDVQFAMERLEHAIKDGCHGRCQRLVFALNQALIECGIEPVKDIEVFLNWLTFAYTERVDGEGNPVMEKPYNVPIWDFFDEANRKELWSELEFMLKNGKMMSMHNVASIVTLKRRFAKTFPK